MTLERFLMELCIGLVSGSLTTYFVMRWHHHDKQKALDELAKVLTESHEITTQGLLELQAKIWAAKDLDEVKIYLRGLADDFIRSLRPVKIVPPTDRDP